MLNLFFRKNFYDGWDNVMFFFVPNLILDFAVIIFTALCIPGVTVFKDAQWYLFVWIALAFILTAVISTVALAWAENSKKIADYETYEVREFFKILPSCISDGIKFGSSIFVILIILALSIKFFFFPDGENQTVTLAGLTAGAVYCWVSLSAIMILSWYPALRAEQHKSYFVSIKKCAIIFLDNLPVSIIISIYDLFQCLVSIIMLGVAPGVAGLTLSRANALRLLLKKYDYIDELQKNGTRASSYKIPWEEILKDDLEANPVRGFKEFWMPWKSE